MVVLNQAKEEGAVITLEEVKNFMKKLPNKQIKGYQNYNSYLPPFARAEFQTDIVDMNKFKQEEEERFALIVIDACSRYASIHPMKNKNSEDVLKALKEAFKIMREPKEIYMEIQAKLKGAAFLLHSTSSFSQVFGMLLQVAETNGGHQTNYLSWKKFL